MKSGTGIVNTDHDNLLTGAVIGAAIDVHRQLGPSLKESAYEEALSKALTKLGVQHQRQASLPLIYKGLHLDCGYRLDLLVENRLPVELKAVTMLPGVHEAQLMTYQRIGAFPLGLLMNFNVAGRGCSITRTSHASVTNSLDAILRSKGISKSDWFMMVSSWRLPPRFHCWCQMKFPCFHFASIALCLFTLPPPLPDCDKADGNLVSLRTSIRKGWRRGSSE